MRAHFCNFNQRISLPANWRGAAFCMIAEKTIKRAFASFIALWAAEATLLETRAQPMLPLTNTVFMAEANLASEKGSIWENGVGEGFRSTTQSFGLSAGVTYGFSSFGSVEAHDLALITLSYGHMLGHVWGEGHWLSGKPGVPGRIIHWRPILPQQYRAPSAPAGGTGLGLAIAKGFVEAQGGMVNAENKPAGGVRFIISLLS
jgi:hypothetical protein